MIRCIRPYLRTSHFQHPNQLSSRFSSSTTNTKPHHTITPGSTNHTSLSTFLSHYSSSPASVRSSTVFLGTFYEYVCAQSLARLGFNLLRTGRANDAGIDLRGDWVLPSAHIPSSLASPITASTAHHSNNSNGSSSTPERALPSTPIRVLAQCKAHRRIGPEHVRELEGAMNNAPVGWRCNSNCNSGNQSTIDRHYLGLLIGRSEASRGVRESISASRLPIGFVQIDSELNYTENNDENTNLEDFVSRQGRIKQFIWNSVAKDQGLEGVGVTVRYLPEIKDEETEREIILTINGLPVQPKLVFEEHGEQNIFIVSEAAQSAHSGSSNTCKRKRGRPRKHLVK